MSTSTTAATVTDYLSDDHRRLDRLLLGALELARAPATLAEAVSRFSEFRRGLERHIILEEEILFPSFEASAGAPVGPTRVMRMEHQEIQRLLAKVGGALDDARVADVERDASDLMRVLGDHNLKEERILYPMSDRLAGDDDARRTLVAKMQAR